MKDKITGVMIATVKSGSGKTTVTCALLEALKERGLKPQAFKCGPDYIDPLFHREVIGISSRNLDSFFATKEQLCEIYEESMRGRGFAVVEGVMGLFDGLGGIREEGSAYDVAGILQLPILLVADAHGMGRSLLPLLSGFLQYDREKRIIGVLLNRISESFYGSIAPILERELQIPVFGFLPKRREFLLESRYLGLKLPKETGFLQKQIQKMAAELERNVLVDKLIEAAENHARISEGRQQTICGIVQGEGTEKVQIGVARDEAFCFYYEENLRLLERYGAELVFFSPLHDAALPEGLDALLIGGGYPELYAEQLEKNSSMRQSVYQAVCDGMPSVAECGGFMYLHHSLEDIDGTEYRMCGVLEGKCVYTGKSVRFGYMELREKEKNFLKQGSSIKGHEFHYYDSEENGQDCLAQKPVTKSSWECILDKGEHFWGFPHLYYLSQPDFVKSFIGKARIFYERKKGIV